MTDQARGNRVHERWGALRFAVVGQLLAAPPGKGELAAAIAALAERTWQHPTTGKPVRFGFSTIERWYYRALKEKRDPVAVLRRKLRADAGQQPAMSGAVRRAVTAQYAAHKSWSVRLHHDNLVVLSESNPDVGPVPSYATLRRFFKTSGFYKRRRPTSRHTEGAERAEARFLDREVRSYEAEYVGSLLHFDAHHGSRKVLTPNGEWVTPILFGVLDDRSRLACHLQWYLSETAEVVVHGLSQAFQKRGLPRASLSDNGPAMTAAEVVDGLTRLGVLQQTTLPYTPESNAKIEILWASVEGRLMAMLEHVADLSLDKLNEATLAWAEGEYNRKVNSNGVLVDPVQAHEGVERRGRPAAGLPARAAAPAQPCRPRRPPCQEGRRQRPRRPGAARILGVPRLGRQQPLSPPRRRYSHLGGRAPRRPGTQADEGRARRSRRGTCPATRRAQRDGGTGAELAG